MEKDNLIKVSEFNRFKSEQLAIAIKPIEDFMNKYCCPHDKLIVTQGYAELLSGAIGIPLEILD